LHKGHTETDHKNWGEHGHIAATEKAAAVKRAPFVLLAFVVALAFAKSAAAGSNVCFPLRLRRLSRQKSLDRQNRSISRGF
jgi:hypothetical protein